MVRGRQVKIIVTTTHYQRFLTVFFSSFVIGTFPFIHIMHQSTILQQQISVKAANVRILGLILSHNKARYNRLSMYYKYMAWPGPTVDKFQSIPTTSRSIFKCQFRLWGVEKQAKMLFKLR
jgi:hypothetical protein